MEEKMMGIKKKKRAEQGKEDKDGRKDRRVRRTKGKGEEWRAI